MKKAQRFWRFLSQFAQNITRDGTIELAAQTAFYLTLSLFPLLLFLVSTLERLRLTLDKATLSLLFPDSVTRLLSDLLDGAPSRTGGFPSLIVSIWSGSAALWALMRGVFRATSEGTPGRNPPWWGRITAIVFLSGLTPIIGLSLFLPLLGEPWVQPLLANLAWTHLLALGIIPYAGTLLGLFAFVLLLYRFTPGTKKKRERLWPGALLSSIGWTLASFLFELYLNTFTNYGALYGGLGAFLGLLLWLFVVSLLILAGAELNALLIRD